eukprot:scaffold16502_cov177-Amphora_coffeaeformis.AAC.14
MARRYATLGSHVNAPTRIKLARQDVKKRSGIGQAMFQSRLLSGTREPSFAVPELNRFLRCSGLKIWYRVLSGHNITHPTAQNKQDKR